MVVALCCTEAGSYVTPSSFPRNTWRRYKLIRTCLKAPHLHVSVEGESGRNIRARQLALRHSEPIFFPLWHKGSQKEIAEETAKRRTTVIAKSSLTSALPSKVIKKACAEPYCHFSGASRKRRSTPWCRHHRRHRAPFPRSVFVLPEVGRRRRRFSSAARASSVGGGVSYICLLSSLFFTLLPLRRCSADALEEEEKRECGCSFLRVP